MMSPFCNGVQWLDRTRANELVTPRTRLTTCDEVTTPTANRWTASRESYAYNPDQPYA